MVSFFSGLHSAIQIMIQLWYNYFQTLFNQWSRKALCWDILQIVRWERDNDWRRALCRQIIWQSVCDTVKKPYLSHHYGKHIITLFNNEIVAYKETYCFWFKVLIDTHLTIWHRMSNVFMLKLYFSDQCFWLWSGFAGFVKPLAIIQFKFKGPRHSLLTKLYLWPI